jgi:hypothetical protein
MMCAVQNTKRVSAQAKSMRLEIPNPVAAEHWTCVDRGEKGGDFISDSDYISIWLVACPCPGGIHR